MKTKLCYLIATSFALLLVGCGATNFYGTRGSDGQAAFSADFLACQAMSNRIMGYPEDNTVKTCLQSKGWTVTTKKNLI